MSSERVGASEPPGEDAQIGRMWHILLHLNTKAQNRINYEFHIYDHFK